MIELTDKGLYCRAGDFHIDPWRPVPRALITHAHADHARLGHGQYWAASAGESLLRHRLGREIALEPMAYGEIRPFGGVEVSLHPAGHILGSAQIRVAGDDGVWVVSGDYKRDADPTCADFEVVPCDTFITEATFALPAYRWQPAAAVASDIHRWWQANAAAGKTTVLFCYALGKAQRLLAALMAYTQETAFVHGALTPLTECYREAGIAMLPTEPVGRRLKGEDFSQALVLAPPSAAGSAWMRRFPRHSAGFASGWMRIRGNRRRRGYDRGFVLSDHVDWPGLIRTIEETGARRVLATHGRTDVLVRYLRERGWEADSLETFFGDGATDV
ncbi:ligase-associated DNA damage response exonuclease [Spectribacter hydrogenoxidans]|uniref:Ligase-associated DNA damage response exonuclease n=1 Tax=Spectribacter hydrogenoxidans TaxID=3075608 RepID=A0ABU3BWK1_9GAMM|nr:ligase-associated DNA damage response exonuclease [Salinisphaera sp. W335]MDT0633531.1 ligase-associated DNA damage response exonuclease [Salinisphaera sp. W335]